MRASCCTEYGLLVSCACAPCGLLLWSTGSIQTGSGRRCRDLTHTGGRAALARPLLTIKSPASHVLSCWSVSEPHGTTPHVGLVCEMCFLLLAWRFRVSVYSPGVYSQKHIKGQHAAAAAAGSGRAATPGAHGGGCGNRIGWEQADRNITGAGSPHDGAGMAKRAAAWSWRGQRTATAVDDGGRTQLGGPAAAALTARGESANWRCSW